MNKKSLIYILAGILAILVAFLLATKVLDLPKQGAADPGTEEPKVEVVISQKAIPKGKIIEEDDLSLINITESQQKLLKAPTSKSECIGKQAVMDIDGGQPINIKMLAEPGSVEIDEEPKLELEDLDPTHIELEIPDGLCALAIESEYLTGVAGYLEVGDVVDIISDTNAIVAAMKNQTGVYFIQDNNNAKKDASQSYLAKNIQVIAVGDKQYASGLAKAEAAAIKSSGKEDGESGEGKYDELSYKYIVLAVPEEVARIIVEVEQNAKLTLTLHPRTGGVQAQAKAEGPDVNPNQQIYQPQYQNNKTGNGNAGTAGTEESGSTGPAPTNSIITY